MTRVVEHLATLAGPNLRSALFATTTFYLDSVFRNMATTYAVDTSYLVGQAMSTGYQWTSLVVPPAYIASMIARRGRANHGLSLNKILRATWIGGLCGAQTISHP